MIKITLSLKTNKISGKQNRWSSSDL